jgi:hypothetical protein
VKQWLQQRSDLSVKWNRVFQWCGKAAEHCQWKTGKMAGDLDFEMMAAECSDK